MNQAIKKLIVACLAVMLSVALMVTATYAWITLSKAPAVENIQITIGGGQTILLAPDIQTESHGQVCHYPGYFMDTLIFSRFDSYDYLNQVDSLYPVSTADGINWFTPNYYDVSDPEVQNGMAAVGDVKPISCFENDNELLNANLTDSDSSNGHYVYLDFWVVSPSTEYTLRVAKGDANGGSYLIDLPKVKEREDGFALSSADNNLASCARIGFLVNQIYTNTDSYAAYQNSRYYNSNYKLLSGTYHEKGSYPYQMDHRFIIYEPNGFLNPLKIDESDYWQTKPIGLINGEPSLIDIKDRLTVQQKSIWNNNAQDVTLDEMLQAAIAGKDINSTKEAEKALYEDYLQGQFSAYLTKGDFVTSTKSLYENCENGKADKTQLSALRTSGATEDVYIVKLEKNIPQRIRMFVWIEGQDVDCKQMTEFSRFALSLELAGSNIK